MDPDGQGLAGARCPVAHTLVIVVTHPDRGDDLRVVAGEPGIVLAIGGTGLSCQIMAVEDLRRHAGAAADDAFHHPREQEGHPGGNGGPARRRHIAQRAVEQGNAPAAGGFDAGNEVGFGEETPAGEGGISPGDLHGREVTGTQNHGGNQGELPGGETKALHIGGGIGDPDMQEDAYTGDIVRIGQVFPDGERRG